MKLSTAALIERTDYVVSNPLSKISEYQPSRAFLKTSHVVIYGSAKSQYTRPGRMTVSVDRRGTLALPHLKLRCHCALYAFDRIIVRRDTFRKEVS